VQNMELGQEQNGNKSRETESDLGHTVFANRVSQDKVNMISSRLTLHFFNPLLEASDPTLLTL